ncbi:MAG: Multidrug export protein MepA [Syntrophus sp. SKADARSKE-3]|nr:Multidrug export protein MepA [Syntrophus sp. SKADARSKE-3]
MTAMLFFALYNLMDTLWLTRLGSQAMAAYAVTFPIQMIFAALGVGTGVGAGSFAARMFGAGNIENARRTAGQVISLSIFFGIVLILSVIFYNKPILLFFGATDTILDAASDYLVPAVFGSPFLLFMMMSNNLLRAEGRPTQSMYAQIIFALTGAILDPFLIFGWGPFPELGIAGAAVSAILGQFAACLLSLHFLLQRSSRFNIQLYLLWPNVSIIRSIYQTGFPSVLINLVFGVVIIIYNHLLSGFGNLALATLGICFRINGLITMVLFGIGHGVMPLVGYSLGARLYQRLIDSVRIAIKMSTIIAALSSIFIIVLADPILSLFTQDPQLKMTALPALRIFTAMMILSGPTIVWINMFIGLGKGLTSMILLLFRDALFLIPCLYILKDWMGITGIWLGQPISLFAGFCIIWGWSTRELKDIASRITQET